MSHDYFFEGQIRVRAKSVVYFDGALAVGIGAAGMRNYDKCLLVTFDDVVSSVSCDDRSRWRVKHGDVISIPVSVSMMGDQQVLLELPSLQAGQSYTLSYRVIDLNNNEQTGSIEFPGI